MARQEGTNRFIGKLGDVVGRKVNGKYIVSKPGGFTSKRLQEEKETTYLATSQNWAEFGKCSDASKAIIKTIDEEYTSNKSTYAFQRLTGALFRKAHADTAVPRGKRRPTPQILEELVGYSLNREAASIRDIVYNITDLDRTHIAVHMPRLSARVQWPNEADGVELFFFGIHLDLKKLTTSGNTFTNAFYTKKELKQITEMIVDAPAKSCILFAGHRFYQLVNNNYYLIQNKKYSPLQMVHYRPPVAVRRRK
jgi:hypothetical protein